jgi:hypothetical protein
VKTEPEMMVYEDGEWKMACTDPSESEMEFEPVGEVIGEDFETSTTVTTVPPNCRRQPPPPSRE